MSSNSPTVHTIVRLFLLDRQARGLSPYTIRWYKQQLAHLARFVGETPMNRVSPEHLRRFLVDFAQSHNPGGVHGAYRATRALFRWCAEEYGIEDPTRKVSAPRVPDEPLEPVPLETVKALLKTCDVDFVGDRDRAILLTLLDTGLRRGELLDLDVDDVDLEGGVIRVRGKGGKWRSVFVGNITTAAILRWLGHRELEGPLWLDNRGKRLSYDALRGMLRRRAKRAGVQPPTPHMFRRAFALAVLRNGGDLISLQRLLGHSSLAVLERYLKQVDDDLRTIHQRARPVDSALK